MISEISAGFDAVIERQIEIVGHLDGLVARDQRGERDDAAVAWRETRALPHLAEKTVLRVFIQRRGDHPDIVTRQRRLRAWRGLRRVRLSR